MKIKLDLKIISFIIYTLILTGLYLTLTPINSYYISCVQGRYFFLLYF
ncbi:DUF2142 domain-containing protein [Brachyspira hyodysenteriae]|nr:DUF2142 domain-containing protein [Brachyspira hyodysenteriae]MBT8730722.1 DUF2142 domain-containing protein [Brachyspira hyodysenteriae]MBT8732984.1 DUF2142 domain-containing protein [Brachyspira hyodysenteriae]MBT8736527.1 DUF2142 domain-containing protein [Brachyspira hyodysenteriae]MBT8738469.1 DUF2142 domain-containing protein [Brachyspira hyodysenteriae]